MNRDRHRKLVRRARRMERGQVLMLVAGLIPMLLGMVGLAVDVGSYAAHKRDLQNAADSVALAAAQRMCLTSCSDTTAATSAANAWAAKNGISASQLTLTFSGGNTAPTVRAVVAATHDFAFIRALGVGSKGVSASAAAAKVSPGGIGGLMPWALTQDAIDASTSGQLVTLHGSSNSPGNFGGFDLDGNGGNIYRDTIMYGSSGRACSVSQANCTAAGCPGTYPSTCAEDSISCDGPVCDSEPGLKTGPTNQGVSYRTGLTSPACDTFSEVFTAVTSYRPPSGLDPLVRQDAPGGGGRLFSPIEAPAAKQPTNTPTTVPTATNTPTATATASNTPLPTNTATPTRTNTPGPTSTPTRTNTPGPSPTPTRTNTPGPTATNTPAATATPDPGTKYGLKAECNPWGAGVCPSPDDGTTLCSRRVIIIPIIDAFGNGRKPATIQGFALFFLESNSGGDVTGRFVRADITMGGLTGAYNPGSLIQSSKLIE